MLESEGVNVGRDKLFNLLRYEGLLVRKKKFKVVTTNSKHWLKKYPNLIIGIEVIKANKLWVADITYIEVGSGYAYLFLITDAYPRKIVGYSLSQSLKTDGGLSALDMALSPVLYQDRKGIIHHSDRGTQYCSKEYVNTLKKNYMLISMTQNGDPYENAIAERVNGILKSEWIYNESYKGLAIAKERGDDIIRLYNSSRPHLSCNMLTPNQAHKQVGALKKHWKARSYTKETANKSTEECIEV